MRHYLLEIQLQSSPKRKKMFKNSKTLLWVVQVPQVQLLPKQDKSLLKLQEFKKHQLNQRLNKLKHLHNNQLLQVKESSQAQLQKLLPKKKELICLKFKAQVQMVEFWNKTLKVSNLKKFNKSKSLLLKLLKKFQKKLQRNQRKFRFLKIHMKKFHWTVWEKLLLTD